MMILYVLNIQTSNAEAAALMTVQKIAPEKRKTPPPTRDSANSAEIKDATVEINTSIRNTVRVLT